VFIAAARMIYSRGLYPHSGAGFSSHNASGRTLLAPKIIMAGSDACDE